MPIPIGLVSPACTQKSILCAPDAIEAGPTYIQNQDQISQSGRYRKIVASLPDRGHTGISTPRRLAVQPRCRCRGLFLIGNIWEMRPCAKSTLFRECCCLHPRGPWKSIADSGRFEQPTRKLQRLSPGNLSEPAALPTPKLPSVGRGLRKSNYVATIQQCT